MKKYILPAILALGLVAVLVLGLLLTRQSTRPEQTLWFGIHIPGEGYGTLADQTGGDVLVYSDGSVRVVMDTEDRPEIATFALSEADVQALKTLVQPRRLLSLPVKEGYGDVCDGSSYYIMIYDESTHQEQWIGGYRPSNEEFWEVYTPISGLLADYGVYEMVDAYRTTMA